ncbi:TetR/AcrR family transcriptional regulator [Streptomyces sp. SID13031]|uniref:TetR/AcrR family transcriptional regulator n=1 Tax=Streptomyces sp. SID13031 TaxID=2706046 RepID=UPI0013C85B55|nr:TetR/AcrR family transcriptional regulator [Streptomyces sp. SID13031]NEA36927.1 TetR family transcriptional regulator [Streptomyces sp. SID13031]
MGLRELKAERTRRRIAEVATDLFLGQGFEETTMEQIAEQAEVGSTTLYRYFPSKDVLALEPLRMHLELGDVLRSRPIDEPLAESLGAILLELTNTNAAEADRFAAIRRVIDNTPGPRAKLWDFMAESRDGLAAAIAERTGGDKLALEVALTAMVVFATLEYASNRWSAGDQSGSNRAATEEVLAELSGVRIILPALPAKVATSARTR